MAQVDNESQEITGRLVDYDFQEKLRLLKSSVHTHDLNVRNLFTLKILQGIDEMMRTIDAGKEQKWSNIIHLDKGIQPYAAKIILETICNHNDYLCKLVEVKTKTIELKLNDGMLSYLGWGGQTIYPVITYIELSYSVDDLIKDDVVYPKPSEVKADPSNLHTMDNLSSFGSADNPSSYDNY